LWAERFDGEAADLFALQNEITSRIANTLGIELIAAEAGPPMSSLPRSAVSLRALFGSSRDACCWRATKWRVTMQ
jgi:hypothetical protein